MPVRLPLLVLCAATILTAQELPALPEAAVPKSSTDSSAADSMASKLRWASALRDEFAKMDNPVAALYGKARLASLVCALDKSSGSKLFREAWSDLKDLPADSFDATKAPLPVTTFSAMWRLVIPAAKSCDPEFNWSDEHLDNRRLQEVGKANLWLNKALDASDPHRVAQLADAAISVGRIGGEYVPKERSPDPTLFIDVLIKLATIAPDLSDTIFKKAITVPPFYIAEGPYDLEVFARYLFPTAPSVHLKVNPRFVSPTRPQPTIPNITRAPLRANLDLLKALLGFSLEATPIREAPTYDLAGAYTLAYQMLSKARLFAPEHVWTLQGALQALEAQPDSYATANRANLGSAPESTGGAPELRDQFVSVAKVLSAIRAGRIDAARRNLTSLGDTAVAHQIELLVDFADAADSLHTRDAVRVLEQPIYPEPGAKRALLYASIAAAAHERESRLKALGLALQDAWPLPAAQRACLLTVLGGISRPIAPDVALGFLEQSIEDENNSWVQRSEHDGKATGENSSLRCEPDGFVEIVKTDEGMQSMLLRVPGVSIYTTDAFLSQARSLDFSRLQAAVQKLRDPTRLAQALIALAELRLGGAD